jgi:hypothetical protein
MTKQEAIREAIRRADPENEGDLLRKLRELNSEAAAELEILVASHRRDRRAPRAKQTR